MDITVTPYLKVHTDLDCNFTVLYVEVPLPGLGKPTFAL